jgi:SAM-dependent methyltransferase
MDAVTYDQWLADTRRFWDASNEFEARYRRICSSPQFDAAADGADEEELRRLWEEETDRAVAMILRGVPIAPTWTCLEIGCGIGRLLKPLANRCRRVIGLDLSEKMAEWSRDYLADTPNAEVRVNDGRALSGIADGSIDFVFSHLAFQHITLFEVVESYVAEIARVLRPGGYCRIQTWRDAPKPKVESLKDIVRAVLGRERYRSNRCWVWSQGKKVRFGGVVFHPRKWRRLLRSHGLATVSTELGVGHDYWMWTTSVR